MSSAWRREEFPGSRLLNASGLRVLVTMGASSPGILGGVQRMNEELEESADGLSHLE